MVDKNNQPSLQRKKFFTIEFGKQLQTDSGFNNYGTRKCVIKITLKKI
jgi:hypothetical protein